MTALPRKPVSQDVVIEAIETLGRGLDARIGAVETRLNIRMDKIESDIAIMKGDVDVMKGDIDVMRGDVDVMKGDIAIMKGDIDVMKGDIDTMKGDIDIMKGDITQLKDGQKRLEDVMTENHTELNRKLSVLIDLVSAKL